MYRVGIQNGKRGLIHDPVNPTDFHKLNTIFCCEQCSYFDPDSHHCFMGFKTSLHDRAEQMRLYNLSGKMAFCRYMEID